MTKSIDLLAWRQRFVDTLPADPRSDNAPRQVRGAAYSRVTPTPVRDPRLLVLVPEVASLLDLEPEITPTHTAALAGNAVLPGMAPYSACYGGHQFGNWAAQLGDGRAITLGEVADARGETWEVQLKGAGRTPYSRTADGRAVLRSSLRELVCSEAMHHLGVPTTRALALVSTGESVVRDILYDGHPAPEPGAIVTRVAPSFLRFGNYEIFAARQDLDTLKKLLAHTLEAHFPELAGDPQPLGKWLAEVCRRTARLMVEWMRVGFVHGVMNTDNMSILGLTIDYGPYGWLEPFDPDWTPNTTDAERRRYRFGNQPAVAHWNLAQLGQALVPLVDDIAELQSALDVYVETLGPAMHAMMQGKLGLSVDLDRADDDHALNAALLELLPQVELDMTLFYRALAELPLDADPSARRAGLASAYYRPDTIPEAHAAALDGWLDRYRARVAVEQLDPAVRRERMNAVNPLYVPRNYLLHQVIEKTAGGDTAALAELLDVLRQPYRARAGLESYAGKRPAWAENQPGCSMLSCSS